MVRWLNLVSLQQEQECSIAAAASEYLWKTGADLRYLWCFVTSRESEKYTSNHPYLVKVLQEPSQYGISTSCSDWQPRWLTWLFMVINLHTLSFSTPVQKYFFLAYFHLYIIHATGMEIYYSQILQQPFASVWIVFYKEEKNKASTKSALNFPCTHKYFRFVQ